MSDISVFCDVGAGLDRWFPLTAASKHDDVQGEVLVEIVLIDQGTAGVRGNRGQREMGVKFWA